MKRVFLLCAVICSGAGAQEIVLARRGENPQFSIVIPAKAPPSQEYAASELKRFVKEMTGAVLPVRRESADGKTVSLVLAPEMGDSFRIKAKDENLEISGGKRGVLYGVYELLEKYGGCGWFASWVSDIPRLDAFAVPADIDDFQRPAFLMREPLIYDMFDGDFAARCKVNGDFRISAAKRPKGHDGLLARHGGAAYPFDPVLKNCHTFSKLLPPKEFYESHPEYYSLVNGERQRIGWQPCLSNPDVLKIVTERVLKRIRENPQTKIFGVSQEDGGKGPCQCDRCKALDDAEGSPSASILSFVNKVAEAVEKEFPDVIIETLAYQYSTLPPTTIRPRRNVMICLCSRCEFSKPIAKSRFYQNIEYLKALKSWREYATLLYVWDYTLNYKFHPHAFPNLYTLQDNLRLFRDCGVTHIFEQGVYASPRSDFAEMKAWLIAKLMWNPDQDFEALLDRFNRGFYGAAAPYVREYIRRLYAIPRDETKYPLKIAEDVIVPAIPNAFFEWASEHFTKALAAVAEDPVRRENVEWCRFGSDFTTVMRFLRGDDCGYLVATADEGRTRRERLTGMRKTAQRMVSLMGSCPRMRFSEQRNRAVLYESQIRELASGGGGDPTRCVIEDSLVWMDPTVKEYCTYVDDKAADDGKAIYMSGRYKLWNLHFDLNQVMADEDGEYAIRARVRVDGDAPHGGEAFRAILGCETNPEATFTIRLKDAGDGYRWHELFRWNPKKSRKLHFSCGRYEGSTPPYKGVYLDKLEIVRVEARPALRKVDLAFVTKDRFIAHGGAANGFIPNTMPSIRKNMENGFGVEVDVFLTNDGKLWCYHDRRGHAKLGIEKWCTNMVWNGELDRCDYSKAYGEKGKGVRPALLEEVFALVTDETPVEIDIKDPRGEPLVKAVKELVKRFPNVTPRNCYLAGRGDLVHAMMPEFRTVATRNSRESLKPGAKPYDEATMIKKLGTNVKGVKAVGPRWDPEVTTPSLFAKYHERGVEIWAWGYHGDAWTMDDPKEALRAFRTGADRLICDDPASLYAGVRQLLKREANAR